MSWTDIAALVGAIATVLGINLAGLRWLLDRRDQKQAAYVGRMDKIDEVLGKMTERVVILERHWENAPGWDTIEKLRGNTTKISEIEGDMKEANAKLDAVKDEQGRQRDSIKRIEDHLLENKE
ncbi:MAG: hypothetical protein WBQ86_09665 [Candidatus Binatus sp.]